MSLLESSMAQTEWRALLGRLGLRLANSAVWHEEWVGRPAGDEMVLRSPIDGSELGALFWGGEEDLDDAVFLATQAAGRLRAMQQSNAPPLGPAIAHALEDSSNDLAQVVAWETGLLLADAHKEIGFALAAFRTAQLPVSDARRILQPVGTVGIITPWVAPLSAWAEVAAPALAAGNAVVWKPSRRASLSALAVQKLLAPVLERMGVAGLHALVGGPGRTLGERMSHDRRLARVAFAGSPAWAKRVAECAGTRALLEERDFLGSAFVVFDEANPKLVLQQLRDAALWANGQGRWSARYLFVQRDLEEELTGYLSRQWGNIRVGSPLAVASQCGPLRDEAALRKAIADMAESREHGAEAMALADQPRAGDAALVDGGGNALRGSLYMHPALLRTSLENPALARAAVFPGLWVVPFGQIEEVLAWKGAASLSALALHGNRLDALRACRQALAAGSVLAENGPVPLPGVVGRHATETFLGKLWLS